MKNYLKSGLTIQQAFVDQAMAFRDKNTRPDFILWGDRKIKTGDTLKVPTTGIVHGEILSAREHVRQGFDIKLKGWIELAGGERVPLLRTMHELEHEPEVSYPFLSEEGRLHTWNVFEMIYPNGRRIEEHWTGNAGMWLESLSEIERIYHCSDGNDPEPDFEAFVYRIKVTE